MSSKRRERNVVSWMSETSAATFAEATRAQMVDQRHLVHLGCERREMVPGATCSPQRKVCLVGQVLARAFAALVKLAMAARISERLPRGVEWTPFVGLRASRHRPRRSKRLSRVYSPRRTLQSRAMALTDHTSHPSRQIRQPQNRQ